MSKLKLQEFLENHPDDWADILMAPPYNLKIFSKDSRILFKYDQINSDFSNPIVQECRGIVLDRSDWSIVKHPFHKFFNLQESQAATIDWQSAEVMSKEDGSLISLYNYKGNWIIATNGTIDADDAPLMFPPNDEIQTFRDLFVYTVEEKYGVNLQEFYNTLNPNYSYLWEICTPINKIVVPYDDYYLFFLTAKRNIDGMEARDFKHPFHNVKRYKFNSLEDVQKAAQELPYDEEGYVVVDKYNNRVKIKSPKFIEVFHLLGNEIPSERRMFNLILEGEDGEFLSYFPEYKEKFEEIKEGWEDFEKLVESDIQYCDALIKQLNELDDKEKRKQFALKAKICKLPGLMFAMYDDRVGHITIKEYVRNMSQNSKDKILREIKRL